MHRIFLRCVLISLCACNTWTQSKAGDAYELINRVQTECEAESLQVGSTLADRYNSLDEATEMDVRMHNDHLTENLGLAEWLAVGVWKGRGKTPHRNHAPYLQMRGGWAGQEHVNRSSFWALENQWLYMMGDSTQRQVWEAFVTPFSSKEFAKDAKLWTRENCAPQFPNRKKHEGKGPFREEGWGGYCGINEVTCDFPGFGPWGRMTFDWKHFAYEDYDSTLR